jgi:diguanylate cyclase (GGDEF)-like protein
MISLKKYLDSKEALLDAPSDLLVPDAVVAALSVYGSALAEMGNCSLEVCPGIGDELKQHFLKIRANLVPQVSPATLLAAGAEVDERLRSWSRSASRHYLDKAREVKDLLMVMAHTAESVGTRDERCAGQLREVTSRLGAIASLDDLTQIRASIEKSATELKTSIERMTTEGKAVLDRLREQVTTYQSRLEEAEELACRDPLTGARSRMGLETLLESRIAAGAALSVAMIDIDGFKGVNDQHGHLVGDELLKQFAEELRSACRATDVIGRWGGDEFLAIFDCGLAEAESRRDRVRKWVCGNYTVQAGAGPVESRPVQSRPIQLGPIQLKVDASVGLAEYQPGELTKDLLARADAAMYEDKARSRRRQPIPRGAA